MTLEVEELSIAPEVFYPDSDGEPMAERLAARLRELGIEP